MIDSDKEELRERLPWGHEVEFTYRENEYVIEPSVDDGGKCIMVIWKITPEPIHIFECPIPEEGRIPDECIQAVLSNKCIDGRSFIEIEDDLTDYFIF